MFVLKLVATVAALWLPMSLAAQNILGEAEPFFFNIAKQDIVGVLGDFSAGTNIPVTISEQVTGEVRSLVGSASPPEFLDLLTEDYDITWFFDGQVIHVAHVSETRTVIFKLSARGAQELEAALAELGISDERYPILFSAPSQVARLTGPPRLISLVETTLSAITLGSTRRPTVTIRRGTETTVVPVD